MKRIALLSDTHGYLDSKMIDFCKNADEIWHAGDVGPIEVIDRLKEITSVRAVFGNIDDAILRQEFDRLLIFSIENIKVMMTHIGGYPNKYAHGIKKLLAEHQPTIFVAGHSHILKVMFDKQFNCLHLNPGAAGTSGFHHMRTMLRFTIDGSHIKDLEIWEHQR